MEKKGISYITKPRLHEMKININSVYKFTEPYCAKRRSYMTELMTSF